MLLLLALWVPASSHLALERFGFLHALHDAAIAYHSGLDHHTSPSESPCGPESHDADGDCLTHGHHAFAPWIAPAAPGSWSPHSTVLSTPPPELSPAPAPMQGPTEPDHRVRHGEASWRFLHRACAPVRAPSLAVSSVPLTQQA